MLSYYDFSKDDFELNATLFCWPAKVIPIFQESDTTLQTSKDANQEELKIRKERLFSELDSHTKQIEEFYTFGDFSEINRYYKSWQKLQGRLENISEKIVSFNRDEELMGFEPTKFSSLAAALETIQPFGNLYQTGVDFQKSYMTWMNGSFLSLDAEAIETDVTNMWRNMYKITLTFSDHPEPKQIADIVKDQIEKFKVHLPLVSILCNPGMRERHWISVSKAIGVEFMPDETTTLASVLDRKLAEFMPALEEISGVASKEFSFEKALQKMYQEWKDVEFSTSDYRDTGTQILAGVDEIQSLLDDHIVKVQTMRGSPFIKAFEEESKTWESKLLLMQV